MGLHHAGELPSGLLPRRRQHQEVAVLREYDAPEIGCALQEKPVVIIGRAVLTGLDFLHQAI